MYTVLIISLYKRLGTDSKCYEKKVAEQTSNSDDVELIGLALSKKLFADSLSEKNHQSSKSDYIEELILEIEKYTKKNYDYISKNLPGVSNKDMLDIWKHESKEFKHLSKVAQLVLGTPSSQVSVERSFSILKFIFNNRRQRLDKDILRKLMFLKLNNKGVGQSDI